MDEPANVSVEVRPPGSSAQAPSEPPSLQKLFSTTTDRQSLCFLALMAWIAACDGDISANEQELLRTVAAASLGGEELLAVVDVARLARIDDLELACRHLSTHADRGSRRLLLELAISMAVQDRVMTVGENLVLQFLADLLGVRPRAFAKLFRRVTHQPFPVAGDPSDPAWWRRREVGEPAEPSPDDWGAESPVVATAGAALPDADDDADETMTRQQALRLLGLGRDPSAKAIHAAYRKLAKARHPDRFAKLGPAAIAAATDVFERLRQAYDVASAPADPASARAGFYPAETGARV